MNGNEPIDGYKRIQNRVRLIPGILLLVVAVISMLLSTQEPALYIFYWAIAFGTTCGGLILITH